MNDSFFKDYVLLSRIGRGSFGEIFRCEEISTKKKRAVKVASKSISNIKQLINEIYIYKQIQGGFGVPNMFWYGKEGNATIMVMDLLGNNLEDLFNQQKRNFSIKTVLLLADQMISRVEYIHKKGIIHHDIKPENFVFGNSIENSNTLYLIDYGLSIKYISNTGMHIKYQDNCYPSGTIRYLSINAHKGIVQSRRDDMESLGYIFIYFLTGKLPWQGAPGDTYSTRSDNVLQIKLENSIEDICYGLPNEFLYYMKDVKSLQFDEEPHYASYRSLFRNLLIRMNFYYDNIYDWTVHSSRSFQVKPSPRQFRFQSQNQNINPNLIQNYENKVQEKPKEAFIQQPKKFFKFKNCAPVISCSTNALAQFQCVIKKPVIK